MDLLTLARVVLRRWHVVLAVAILTLGSGVAVVVTAEAEQNANAVVMLTGQNSDGEATTLDQVLDPGVIAEVVQGSSVRAGLDTNVPYTVDVAGDGEILRVTATDVSPDGLVETVEAVMDAIASEVQTRQHNADIPQEDQARAEFLRMPDQPIAASDGSEFTASGSVLLAPANASNTQPYPPNSYTLSLLETWLASEEALLTLAERGAESAYTAGFDARAPAPMMIIDVTGTTNEDPIETMNLVIDLIREELAALQDEAGVPEAVRTRVEDISVPSVATETSSGLLRPLVVVVGLGVIAALALAVVTDGVAQALARRRAETESELRRELLAKAVNDRSGSTDEGKQAETRPRYASANMAPRHSERTSEPHLTPATFPTPSWSANASSSGDASPVHARNGSDTDSTGDSPLESHGNGLIPSVEPSSESAETVELRIPDDIRDHWARQR